MIQRSFVPILWHYFRIWRRSVILNFSILGGSRIDFVTFILGKLIRMGFFLIFAIALFQHVPTIAGYTKGEVLLFFAIMNIIDIFVQLIWYRGLTDLQRLVRTGEFDLVLTKPMSPLFWSAFRIFDLFDLVTVPAAILFLWYAVQNLTTPLTLLGIASGVLFGMLSLVLAFAVNLILASLTFVSTEMDNAWWIYRDTVYVARFPPDIFPQTVRFFFIFCIPILVIVTFPTQALLGRLTGWMMLWAFIVTILCTALAMTLWRTSLRRYTSASS